MMGYINFEGQASMKRQRESEKMNATDRKFKDKK
jgi:hypothetical protein